MVQIDMPMPHVCDECEFYDDNGDYPHCIVTDTYRGYNFRGREKRMDDCPLKEVEPHILSLDEVRKKESVWLEVEDMDEIYPCLVDTECSDGRVLIWSPSINIDKYYVELFNNEEDMKHIRCWSSKPTKEQRKGTKWSTE